VTDCVTAQSASDSTTGAMTAINGNGCFDGTCGGAGQGIRTDGSAGWPVIDGGGCTRQLHHGIHSPGDADELFVHSRPRNRTGEERSHTTTASRGKFPGEAMQPIRRR
jgi:hypothetical protein